MLFRQLFDRESSTYTYLIADQDTRQAVIIDPVREQSQRDLQLLKQLQLQLISCLETHIHADHVTASSVLREATGCKSIVPINANIDCADRFIQDQEVIIVGNIEIKAIETLGHTNSHMAYLINHDRILTGDALLIRGCGRTDFQGGDAGKLFDAITQKLFSLDNRILVYPAHDYKGFTVSTIGEEKQFNPRFLNKTRQQFIEFMNNLDLPHPTKMMEALPANQKCGNAT